MPSIEHNGLVEMFRGTPDLAPAFLSRLFALPKVVERMGLVLSSEQRDRIERCDDPATLDLWLDRALAAKTADELFA